MEVKNRKGKCMKCMNLFKKKYKAILYLLEIIKVVKKITNIFFPVVHKTSSTTLVPLCEQSDSSPRVRNKRPIIVNIVIYFFPFPFPLALLGFFFFFFLPPANPALASSCSPPEK